MNLVNEGVLPPDELDDHDERREEQERARGRETVADIVAEKRTRANEIERDVAAKMKSGEMASDQYAREVVADLRKEADRIEAAAKRDEERAVEHATRHAEAVARDNCRDCVHNPSGKNYESGNAAAVREALVEMVNADTDGDMTLDSLCGRCIDKLHGTCKHDGSCWCEKVIAALSAPARNCDLYDTQPTMSMAYEAYRKAAMRSYGNGLTGAVPTVKQKPMTYDEWLLAPAAERKGEGDGSK